jgi:biopolymer transport protein TolR
MITEINVTPLVDIMLVLLIIFMLTANVISKRRAIEVDLPTAAAANALQTPPLAVTVTKEGRLSIDGAPGDEAQLRAAVKATLAKNPKAQAVIAADKETAHGRVVWVIDVVKSLGMAAFAIEIDPTQLVAPTRSGP